MSILFLICSERSGSNFITKLLNGHPNICGPATKHIINPVARNLFRYGDLSVESNWHELLQDIYELISVSFRPKSMLNLDYKPFHGLQVNMKAKAYFTRGKIRG